MRRRGWIDLFLHRCPSPKLSEILELEADRYQGLVLESQRVETERSVVLNERRECVDNDPDGLLTEILGLRPLMGILMATQPSAGS